MQMSFGTGESIALVLFVVISLYHQFLNNFFGEYILQKQSSISVALYNVPWWRANKNVRQLLMFMIARTNMQTNIMGFYMYKLCLKSFIAFVKALYTYYMVLRQMNQTST
ncbi:odorant receptor 85b-like isoform X2 [Daktulosphaira vitifoliae]|nr:odorant receptor 85b-like isoform X2 [Daktulosphaira vitifoliae]